MKTFLKQIAVLLALLSIAACAGNVKVTNSEGLSSVKGNTITVVSRGPDPEGVRGLIEQALLEKGYNIVSEEVARSETRADAASAEVGPGQVATASVYNQTLVRSAYVLSFTYSTRPDFPRGVVIRNLSASVIDIRSGAVVSSLRFSQGDFASTSIEGAIRKLLEQM